MSTVSIIIVYVFSVVSAVVGFLVGTYIEYRSHVLREKAREK